MADKAMLDNLTKLASRFRLLIENADRSKLPISFENFPAGSCGDAAILLAQYLIDAGCDTPTYVSAELVRHPNLLSHAWIELDGIVLDITADGFEADAAPVIVTENSAWHDRFDRFDEHPAAINVYEDRIVSMLTAAYHEITRLRIH